MTSPIVYITGPTATGKTRRAVSLAHRLGAEIVSADSRQVYRNMDLGTGKDLGEYGDVPVHMIDIVDAGYRYNLYEYLRDANAVLDSIAAVGKPAIVCGGTGLYVESLAKGVKLPEVPANKTLREELEQKPLAELTQILASMKRLHNTTDVDTVKRAVRAIEIEKYYQSHPEAATAAKGTPNHDALIIVVDIDRETRRERISRRLRERFDDGMVAEVRVLMEQGVDEDTLLYYGLEYKFIMLYITGKLTYTEMVSLLETAIHQFAKRQMTWFRGMERRGFRLQWLPYDMDDEEFNDAVITLIESKSVK